MKASAKRKRTVRARSRLRETEPPPQVVVLAAGVGSRMRSTLPKVLHRVGGRTLLDAVLDIARGVSPSQVVAVIGAGREKVESALAGRDVTIVVQDPPLGTGDAARRALSALNVSGPVVILSGDTPLLTAATVSKLIERRREKDLDLAFLTFRPPESGDLGRVVRDSRGRVRRIVEARNATARESRLTEANAGVYCFSAPALSGALAKLVANRLTKEFYLTDAVEILASAGGAVQALEADDWREGWGVNTRRDLAAAEEIERRRCLERALDAGATIVDPATTRIGAQVRFEPDAVVHPFVCLEGTTVLEQGSEVLPFTRVLDSTVGPAAVVGPHCEIEGAEIGARARVGPFARLRPGTVLEKDVRVGNFVETKKAVLREGVKASHLSYLGDTEIGAGANIGAGVITCNYDGERKHHTSIGEGAFIGSDSQLVAPVTVGKGAYVGAGSTITRDVPEGALAVTRTPQTNVEGWVAKRRARKERR